MNPKSYLRPGIFFIAAIGLSLGLLACPSQKSGESPPHPPTQTQKIASPAPVPPPAAPAPSPAAAQMPSSAASAPTEAPPSSAPGSDQAKQELSASFKHFMELKSFQAKSDATSDQGTLISNTIDFLAPDSYHLQSSVKLAQDMGDKREFIIIGANSYVKTGEAPWEKFPMDMGSIVKNFRDQKMLDSIQKDAEVSYVGTDTLDGKPVKVFNYTIKNVLGLAVTSHCKAWISVSDNLPLKIEVDGEYAKIKSHMVILYSKFNEPLEIKAPM